MNTYLQLLRDSMLAPRAAVDLARQHPNPLKLGWIFVGILSACALISQIIVQYVLRPWLQISVADSSPATAWMDSVFGTTLLSFVSYIFVFVGQRWFWRINANTNVSQQAVDAAIIAGFAISIVIILPQDILIEVLQNSSSFAALAAILFPIAVGMAYATVYFSHGLGISLSRSLWLNVLFILLLIAVGIIALLVYFVAFAVFTGSSFDKMFAVSEAVQ